MQDKPTISECIAIAAQALRANDIPAVIFYDTQVNAVIAESTARFVMRPDISSRRYQILMRVEEGMIAAAESICKASSRKKAAVVDIKPMHSAPPAHLRSKLEPA